MLASKQNADPFVQHVRERLGDIRHRRDEMLTTIGMDDGPCDGLGQGHGGVEIVAPAQELEDLYIEADALCLQLEQLEEHVSHFREMMHEDGMALRRRWALAVARQSHVSPGVSLGFWGRVLGRLGMGWKADSF